MTRGAVAAVALAALAGADGSDPRLLLVLAGVLVAAKAGGAAVARLGQPAVLGELAVGIAAGNLGWRALDGALADPRLGFVGELGVLLLLFEVGLASDLAQMARVGRTALAVACVGVAAPMALGFGVAAVVAPATPWQAHLFLGAVLSATSVGITARVLKDLGHVDTPTGRVVLGAAVIDDVLGLIVLAVVAGVVHGAATGDGVDALAIAAIVGKALGFLAAAVVLGPAVSRRLYRAASLLEIHGVLLAVSLAFALAVAWAAHAVGLAPIVGAFAAGLVLDDVVFHDHLARGDKPLDAQLEPLAQVLVPVFFVLTGAQVDLRALTEGDALILAAGLTAAAIVGKQACAVVASGPGIHRRSVGIGMIPRGEVGLIFAATGARLVLHGEPVISSQAYAAIVVMVMVTTVVTPPLLGWSLRGVER